MKKINKLFKNILLKLFRISKYYCNKTYTFIIKDMLHLDHLDVRILKKKPSVFQSNQRYAYQKKFIKFNIKKGDKVLDLGSGADPFPLATHLADLYEDETSHRPEGSSVVKDKRPFIRCDIEKTPFKDKEFDFVYCSHVLEHVGNPAKACEEIMRIGKRGYIETPTRMSDIIFNFTKLEDHHKWHINMVDNTLIFIAWRPEERRDTKYNDFRLQFHSKWQNPIQQFVHENRDLLTNMFLWDKEFNYIVINDEGEIVNQNLDLK